MKITANGLLRAFQGSLPALEELRIGRAFILSEITENGQFVIAEVILRQVRSDEQGVEVAVFVIYSTDSGALPPGDTIERRMNLANDENTRCALAQIHYY